MLYTLAFLAFIALASAQVNVTIGDPATWKDCSGPNAAGKIGNVNINPNPPVPGSSLKIGGTGTLNIPVNGGSAELSIKYAGLTIFRHTSPVCGSDSFNLPMGLGDITVNALTCPQAAGAVDIETVANLGAAAPRG